jgi:hypothetical protein
LLKGSPKPTLISRADTLNAGVLSNTQTENLALVGYQPRNGKEPGKKSFMTGIGGIITTISTPKIIANGIIKGWAWARKGPRNT